MMETGILNATVATEIFAMDDAETRVRPSPSARVYFLEGNISLITSKFFHSSLYGDEPHNILTTQIF